MTRSVRVSVPATTANLGPGFDSIGLAVNLRNEIIMQIAGERKRNGVPTVSVEIEGRGEHELSHGRENLVVAAAERLFAHTGGIPERISVRMLNQIPLGSGMGSSAAAITAGLVAANELCDQPLGEGRLLDMAAEMEGHPDNVAPALMGGFTICALEESGRVRVLQPRVRTDLTCIFCVPSESLSTTEARNALPKSYSRCDMIFTISRVAMLTALLQGGDSGLFRLAMQDRVHQPYRAKMMPGLMESVAAAYEAGAVGACFSGSGPTVLAFLDRSGNPEKIGAAMAAAYARFGITSELISITLSRTGARVSHS